jgi:signal transduction histidine kinase
MGVQTEIIVLRMIQESLNNAIKHAPGAPITLLLDYKPDTFSISIVDQGPGFSMKDLDTKAVAGSGQGLYNLRRRATLLGGTCNWEAAYETEQGKQGTKVLITIPSTNTIHQDFPVKDTTEPRIVTA